MAKILVIEDETILRNEVVEWLTLEGYGVVEAVDGLTGIAAALHHLPDLIVCDILMPHVDGYGVLLEIHSHSTTSGIPFIFLTAKAAQDEIRKGMDLGADDYITKPFTRLALLHAIEARLAKKQMQSQAHQQALAQLQQALTQANEHGLFRAKLLSMFSHDFANSLTSILMTNSPLRNYSDKMDANRRQVQLNRIESSVNLLLQMLDDLLIIAQVETGGLTFTPNPVNVPSFFQRLATDCQAIYGDRCQLLLESQKNHIEAIDVRLLRLIAANLIAHAVKTSPKGSTVRFLLESTPENCILTAHDQSMNTTLPERQRFLTALQQHSDPATLAILGLDLAVAKEAVALQGGSIQVASQPEGGTTITVTLPIQQQTNVINERKLVGD